MTKKSDAPAIRFKGFSDAWEQRKLGELALFNPKDELPQTFEYVDLESVVGTEMLSHRTEVKSSAPSRAQRLAHTGDLFYQTVRPYQKNNYLYEKPDNNYVFSTGYAQMRPYVDGYFLLSLVQSERFVKVVLDNCTGTSYPAINANDLAEIEVAAPSDESEAQKIGTIFRSIDNLITLHQRKFEKLTNVKKSMLEKMFPQNGSSYPEIRFKGFTDPWEQRKLSELTSMHARIGWQNLRTSEFLDSGNYMLITGTDFNDGAINFSTCHYVERERYEQDRNIQIHNGSILITKDGTLGKVAYVQGLSMPATLNAGVFNVQIKDANNVDEKYLFQYLKAPFLMDYVDKKATGGTIKHLNQSILVDFPVILPQRSEQTLIGAFFQQLDNLITLHQRECISFTARAGRLILTANKKRNTSSWEQRKVSDLAEKTYGGGTPTTSNEAYWNGDIPWIQSSDVVDGKLLGVEPRKWITQDGLNNSAAQLIPGNSIAIITRVGVGKLAFMPYSYATSQDFLSLSKLNAEPLFTVYACYKKLQSELNAVQGTSIKGITKDELLAKNIMVPRYAEQQQIGAFFKQLDNLITLHQRKPFLMKWRTSDANRNKTNRLVL